MTNIEVGQWELSCSEVAALFVARTTATDVAEGLRFSLQEQDANANELLADIALPWTPPHPPPGTEIRVFLRSRITATGLRVSGGEVLDWSVTWCQPPAPTQVRRSENAIAPLTTGTTDVERAHEFTLVDENDVSGSGRTLEDALVCDGTEVIVSSKKLLSPYELIARGMPITASRWNNPGHGLVTEASSADDAGTLGVSFSDTGVELCRDVAVGEPTTFYVFASPAGAAICGITGAEFRVTAVPAGWFATGASPPGTLILGDPLDGTGCNVAYPACQSGERVLFFTGLVLPLSRVAMHPLIVEPRNPPLSPNFQCPLVTLCDAPVYTKVCVRSGPTAYLDPVENTPCSISQTKNWTWGAVKRLYD